MHPRCRNPYFGIKISNQFVNRLRTKGVLRPCGPWIADTAQNRMIFCWNRLTYLMQIVLSVNMTIKMTLFSGNATMECVEQPVHQSSWTIIVSKLPRKWFNVMVKILKRFQFFRVNSLTGPLSLSQKSDNLYRKCKKWWEFRTKIHQKWLKNYLKMHNS